jgi:uncharacterized protein YydD (DUF2326 family)
MRLISLTANMASFKPVVFNPTGLTLVVARQRGARRPDPKNTFNGVGKSLLVALVNYCLGANRNEHFDAHLAGWEFTLTFEANGREHTIVRATGGAKPLLDGEEVALTKLNDWLAGEAFQMPADPVPFLTFRSLLAFFLRPKSGSYVAYDRPEPKWKEYQSVLCQSFLLGLDYHRAVQKHDQKKKLDELTELADRYKKDKELREFYLGEKSAEVELADLGTQVARLEADLAAFRVAENYAERERRADDLHRQLGDLGNRLVVLRTVLDDLDLSLRVQPDVAPERVVAAYEEAAVNLPAAVVKRLDEVREFHRRLEENRRTRLGKERAATEQEVAAVNARMATLRAELDAELQFLNAHRALDEYAANNAHLTALKGREQRIRDYLRLLSQYTEEAQKVKVEMAQATVETNRQLRDARPHLELLMGRFREFSRELYGPVPAGLTVRNNDGENQCRYDIEAHIESDAGDGINQGKIFCYDLLLLDLRQRHRMGFLFHDSRLFAHMDPRQRVSLFRLADRVCREGGFQYIASLNEDALEAARELAGEDARRLFVDPVKLELTDAPGGSGKLLGIQIDMKYDD